jgi:hypothetical protein
VEAPRFPRCSRRPSSPRRPTPWPEAGRRHNRQSVVVFRGTASHWEHVRHADHPFRKKGNLTVSATRLCPASRVARRRLLWLIPPIMETACGCIIWKS